MALMIDVDPTEKEGKEDFWICNKCTFQNSIEIDAEICDFCEFSRYPNKFRENGEKYQLMFAIDKKIFNGAYYFQYWNDLISKRFLNNHIFLMPNLYWYRGQNKHLYSTNLTFYEKFNEPQIKEVYLRNINSKEVSYLSGKLLFCENNNNDLFEKGDFDYYIYYSEIKEALNDTKKQLFMRRKNKKDTCYFYFKRFNI